MDDAIAIEVFRHRISAVAEEMGAALQHTASSPNIKERRDYSCAVFDGMGRLLAQAAHIPVHLGAMPFSVAAVRQAVTEWNDGDVVALNHPFLGGSHLPDVTTVSAIKLPATPEPLLFLATRAHHADIGGGAPGSMGAAADLYGEGLVLPPVRLVRVGEIDEDIIGIVCANSRTPEERRGDLEAQIAAHRVGEVRIRGLLSSLLDRFEGLANALLDYSERRSRAVLARMPSGTFAFEDTLDCDGNGTQMRLCVELLLGAGDLRVDFSGTSGQADTGVNSPLAVTHSAVYYVVACLLGDTPINAGAFRPVQVTAPPGCLLNPGFGAAVAAGNVETSQRIVDVLLGALSKARPDLVPAASQGTMNNLLIGGIDPRNGRPYTYYETIAGGSGGGPDRPGASGIQVHMTNTRSTPVEAMETEFPLRVEASRLRAGSGGCGLHPGGDGVLRRLRMLEPALVTVISDRRSEAPWGLAGGSSGMPGVNIFEHGEDRLELPSKFSLRAAAGDVIEIATPGGGGWGKALTESSRKEVQDD